MAKNMTQDKAMVVACMFPQKWGDSGDKLSGSQPVHFGAKTMAGLMEQRQVRMVLSLSTSEVLSCLQL